MKRIDDPENMVIHDDGFLHVFEGMWDKIDQDVKWRNDDRLGGRHITLSDIREQFPDVIILTVVHESYLHGEIYQVGNYSDGKWWQIGELDGFA